MKSDEKIILYGPKDGKSLTRLYPELLKETAFKDLPSEDLLFAWYYGNPTSPIDSEDPDTLRASAAAPIAYKKHPEKMKKAIALSFDEGTKAAILRMRAYAPDARAMAKRIAQMTLNNYYQMVNVDVSDFEYIDKDNKKQIDWTGREAYVRSTAKINEVMPHLLDQVEGGYGVEVSNETAFKGEKAIDTYHKQKHNA